MVFVGREADRPVAGAELRSQAVAPRGDPEMILLPGFRVVARARAFANMTGEIGDLLIVDEDLIGSVGADGRVLAGQLLQPETRNPKLPDRIGHTLSP